ncbi:MAG: lasso peptide biosynthesis B2 protein [Planctomycetes bacterium]|nr:lasso peptide biosynthesis B2 protein [Planctomycetota bacterium]
MLVRRSAFFVFCRAWLWLLVLRAFLRLRGMRSACRLLSGRQRVSRRAPVGMDAERLERLVERAARLQWPRPGCLARSLVLWHLAALEGIESELLIGVEAGGRAAHAWVECGGRVLNDAPDVRERFTAFSRPARELFS